MDEGSTLIRQVEATAANVHDLQVAEELVQWDEQAVYADKAYDSEEIRRELKRMGVADGILRRKKPGKKQSAEDRAHNKRCSKVRAEVERPFAWWKELFGIKRCRYVGLEANRVHFNPGHRVQLETHAFFEGGMRGMHSGEIGVDFCPSHPCIAQNNPNGERTGKVHALCRGFLL